MLVQIQTHIDTRVASIRAAHPEWPCAKGCADCCRSLASEPLLSESEWRLLEPLLTEDHRQNIQAQGGKSRPVICPLLDQSTNACQVYAARPLACRTYGYYAERDKVLGCHRIESLAATHSDILWGNQLTLERQATALGPQRPLSHWLNRPGAVSSSSNQPPRADEPLS